MTTNWYVRFSDSKKAEKVSYDFYRQILIMARFYKAIISDNFHPHGKTLTVAFSKHFV